MRISSSSWLVVSLLIGGCTELRSRSDHEGTARAAIINGQHDVSDSSVVMLLIQDDPNNPTKQGKCTATVVSPHVLLTAAHCLHPEVLGYDPAYVVAFTGDDIDDPDQGTDIDFFAFEEAHVYHPLYENMLGTPYDVGVVILEDPLDLKPIRINRNEAPAAGAPLHLVGFGLRNASDPDSFGARESTDAAPSDVTATHIEFADAGLCVGDSGGPSLRGAGDGQEIVGVHSWGENIELCNANFYDVLLTEELLAFIDAHIEESDPGFLDSQAPPPAGDGGAGGGGGGGDDVPGGAGGEAASDDERDDGCATSPSRNRGSTAPVVAACVLAAAMRRRSREAK